MTLEEIEQSYNSFDSEAEKIREIYRLNKPVKNYFTLKRNGKYPDFYITFAFNRDLSLPEEAKNDFADLFIKKFPDNRSGGINFSEVEYFE